MDETTYRIKPPKWRRASNGDYVLYFPGSNEFCRVWKRGKGEFMSRDDVGRVRIFGKMAEAKSAAEGHYRERLLEALEVVDAAVG